MFFFFFIDNFFFERALSIVRKRMSGYASRRPSGGMNTHRCVKNVHNTSSDRYAISGLKQKYSAYESYPSSCQVYGCSHAATATAHVISADGRSNGSWSAVPMCAAHNHYTQDQPMFLKSSARPVPVSQLRK